jgi:hypothetical protein
MDRLALGENDRELEKLKRNWRFANKGPLSSSSSFFFFFFFFGGFYLKKMEGVC